MLSSKNVQALYFCEFTIHFIRFFCGVLSLEILSVAHNCIQRLVLRVRLCYFHEPVKVFNSHVVLRADQFLYLQFSNQLGLGLKSLPLFFFLAAGGSDLKCTCINGIIELRITYF